MRKSQIAFFFRILIVLSISTLLFPVTAWSSYKTSLSDTHIQSALVKHFPIREYAAFARVTLHEPQVILSRNSKKLFLVIPVDVNFPDQPQRQGHARIAVKISYKPSNGGLYLVNPQVIKLEMPNISKIMNKNLKEEIATICLNSLPLIQIFKIKESALNHSLDKSVLKSFSIKDGFVGLVFGFK